MVHLVRYVFAKSFSLYVFQKPTLIEEVGEAKAAAAALGHPELKRDIPDLSTLLKVSKVVRILYAAL